MFDEACEELLIQAGLRRAQAIAAAEADYRLAVQSVRLFRKLRGMPASGRVVHGKLSSAVLAAVEEMNGDEFTVRDISERLAPEIAERTSPASISTTLRRLVGKKVRLAEAGNGTRPSRYQRLDQEVKAPLNGVSAPFSG